MMASTTSNSISVKPRLGRTAFTHDILHGHRELNVKTAGSRLIADRAPSVWLNWRSNVKFRRICSAAEAPIRRSGHGLRNSIASPTNAARSISTDRPVTPSTINSLVPLVRVRSTGTPAHIASAQA